MVPEILSTTDRIFCHLENFSAIYPLKTRKIKIKKKKEKTPDSIIILHKCTKSHDHMLYCSWNMARDRCNYFSFWTMFCPFIPLTAQKMKTSKKWKKFLEMSSFYTSIPKIFIICYIVLEIGHMTDVIVIFHFGLFFALLPS